MASTLLSGNSGGFQFGVAPVLPQTELQRASQMTSQRITKCMVDALKPNGSEFTLWDDTASGFGVRLRPTGAMSYVVVLQGRRRSRCAGAALYHRRGRENRTGQARARAKAVLCSVAHGHDPAGQKTTERGVPTIAELADRFMAESRDNRSASFIRRSPIPRSKPIVYSQWSAVCTHSRHGPLSCPKGPIRHEGLKNSRRAAANGAANRRRPAVP